MQQSSDTQHQNAKDQTDDRNRNHRSPIRETHSLRVAWIPVLVTHSHAPNATGMSAACEIVAHMDIGELLHFEANWPGMSGAKEAAIRAQFGVSATRYYQALNLMTASGVAAEMDPFTVRRLQKGRERRIAARAQKKFSLSD